MSRNLLTWPSFYGGANRSIPRAWPLKVCVARVVHSQIDCIDSVAERPLFPRQRRPRIWGYLKPTIRNTGMPARSRASLRASTTSRCSKRNSIHAVTQTVAFLRVRTTQKWPRARHPRLVKMTRVWRGRWREQALSLVLTIQLLILFVMPAARAVGLPSPHIVVRGALLILAALGLVLGGALRRILQPR